MFDLESYNGKNKIFATIATVDEQMVLMCAQLWHAEESQRRAMALQHRNLLVCAPTCGRRGGVDSAVLWVLHSSSTLRLLRCAAAW